MIMMTMMMTMTIVLEGYLTNGSLIIFILLTMDGHQHLQHMSCTTYVLIFFTNCKYVSPVYIISPNKLQVVHICPFHKLLLATKIAKYQCSILRCTSWKNCWPYCKQLIVTITWIQLFLIQVHVQHIIGWVMEVQLACYPVLLSSKTSTTK